MNERQRVASRNPAGRTAPFGLGFRTPSFLGETRVRFTEASRIDSIRQPLGHEAGVLFLEYDQAMLSRPGAAQRLQHQAPIEKDTHWAARARPIGSV